MTWYGRIPETEIRGTEMKEYDELFMKKAIELSADVLKDQALEILREYFSKHNKG